MSNKNLLNESQVRQFMKLASLQPLTPGFVHGLTERGSKAGDDGPEEDGNEDESETHAGANLEERETAPPGGPRASHGRGVDKDPLKREALGEEDPAELEGDIAHDLGDDSLEGDEEALGDEEEIGAEMVPDAEVASDGAMVDVQQFMDLLKTALETAVSEITGEPTEVEVADDVVDVEDEVGADAGDAEEMEMDVDMSAADEEDPLEEDTTNELVERITKRVAARILKSALTAKK
jgi:hypothetical protein